MLTAASVEFSHVSYICTCHQLGTAQCYYDLTICGYRDYLDGVTYADTLGMHREILIYAGGGGTTIITSLSQKSAPNVPVSSSKPMWTNCASVTSILQGGRGEGGREMTTFQVTFHNGVYSNDKGQSIHLSTRDKFYSLGFHKLC